MSNEKRIMKAVEILISELHSHYEGNVKLAMAQLIILGERAAPYMNA